LNRQLRTGIFAALDQRIATRFTIKAMDLAESAVERRTGNHAPLIALRRSFISRNRCIGSVGLTSNLARRR